VKYDLTLSLPAIRKIQVGGAVKRFAIDYDTASPFGNDTPYAPQPGLSPFALTRRFSSAQAGAYAQATQDLGRGWNVTYGARLDHYAYLRATRVSPRAGVSYRVGERWSWQGSYGRYVQQPFFLFLAAFDENRALAPFESDHLVSGLTFTGRGGTRLSVEAYRKVYRRYPVARDLPQLSLANVGDTFATRDLLFPLVSEGRGDAAGIELFAERKPGGVWFGVASLAIARARHAGRDGVLRPGSFDYPVVLNLSGSWRWRPRWLLSARAVYLSGRPYTPFDEPASIAQRRGVFDLARVNAVRAPAYARLDVRVDRTVTIGGREVTMFAGVQNVTNRRNFASYGWNRTRNAAEFNDQTGIFPLVGLDWPF
jgi:hypothetical protein